MTTDPHRHTTTTPPIVGGVFLLPCMMLGMKKRTPDPAAVTIDRPTVKAIASELRGIHADADREAEAINDYYGVDGDDAKKLWDVHRRLIELADQLDPPKRKGR